MEKETIEILKHKYVPKYSILKEEEIQELLVKYNISPKQLPKMLSNDPIAKLLGVKPGSILKIVRRSPTTNESVTYRVIVHA